MLEQGGSTEKKLSAQTWKRKILRTVSGKHERTAEGLWVSTFPSSISPISSGESSKSVSPTRVSDEEEWRNSEENKNSLGYFSPALEQESSFGVEDKKSGLGRVSDDRMSRAAIQDQAGPFDVSWRYQQMMSTPKSKGPKVKPFIFTQSQQRISRTMGVADRKCFICGEFLKTKLQMEKLIDLKCGDSVHEECFNVTIDFRIETLVSGNEIQQGSSKKVLDDQIFPSCGGNGCSTDQRHNKCVPVDKTLTDNIITRALLSQKEKLSREGNNNLLLLSSTLKSKVSDHSLGSKADSSAGTEFFDVHQSDYLKSPISVASRFDSLQQDTDSPSQVILQPSRSNSKCSRITRSPSPNPSLSTVNTSSIKVAEYDQLSQEKVKSIFIEYLLDNCPEIDLSKLDDFGELRLMDELLVKLDASKFQNMTVYLFKNFMVLWRKGYEKVTIFPLKNTIIKTYNPSKLQFINPLSSPSHIWLSCDIGSIIEKWVVALSDFDYQLPSAILTSTIILPSDTIKQAGSVDFGQVMNRRSEELRLSDSTLSEHKFDMTYELDTTLSHQSLENTSPIIGPVDELQTPLVLESKPILEDRHPSNASNSLGCPDMDSDEDSDEDSDKEMIDSLLGKGEVGEKEKEKKKVKSSGNGWQQLLEDIDNLLYESSV